MLTSFYICIFSYLNVNAEDSFLNKNNVLIYSSDYEVLEALGYEEDEIMNLTQEKIDELREINVSKTYNNEIYLKYDTSEESENSIFGEQLSKETFYNEVEEYNKISEANNGISICSVSGTSPSSEKEYDYVAFKVWGVWDATYGSCGKMINKIRARYITNPSKRLTDIIGFCFSNNVHICKEDIDEEEKPKYEIIVYYDVREYENYDVVDELAMIDYYDASNSEYIYKIDEGIAIMFELPSASDIFTGQNDGDGRGEAYIIDKITLECSFIPKENGINAATFVGWYAHQLDEVYFIFDELDINFELSFPFVTFTGTLDIETKYLKYQLAIYFEDLYVDDEEDDSIGTC